MRGLRNEMLFLQLQWPPANNSSNAVAVNEEADKTPKKPEQTTPLVFSFQDNILAKQ